MIEIIAGIIVIIFILISFMGHTSYNAKIGGFKPFDEFYTYLNNDNFKANFDNVVQQVFTVSKIDDINLNIENELIKFPYRKKTKNSFRMHLFNIIRLLNNAEITPKDPATICVYTHLPDNYITTLIDLYPKLKIILIVPFPFSIHSCYAPTYADDTIYISAPQYPRTVHFNADFYDANDDNIKNKRINALTRNEATSNNRLLMSSQISSNKLTELLNEYRIIFLNTGIENVKDSLPKCDIAYYTRSYYVNDKIIFDATNNYNIRLPRIAKTTGILIYGAPITELNLPEPNNIYICPRNDMLFNYLLFEYPIMNTGNIDNVTLKKQLYNLKYIHTFGYFNNKKCSKKLNFCNCMDCYIEYDILQKTPLNFDKTLKKIEKESPVTIKDHVPVWKPWTYAQYNTYAEKIYGYYKNNNDDKIISCNEYTNE